MSTLAIGIMSGTSLDGIDIALCRFSVSESRWDYDIVDAQTVGYSPYWIDKLRNAQLLSAEEFLVLHNEYGLYIGELILEFLRGKEHPELVASHGHTIFHQPEKKFTFQLGNGASIASKTGISTVSDFRTFNVALGGQGAPLVPVGDHLLFPEFGYCLNIGGFANISFCKSGKRIAFDICPANILLNELAQRVGLPYDKEGQLGASGIIDQSLLQKLNALDYYTKTYPKSLGREWLDQLVKPLLFASGSSIEDQAATIYEHIADQISRVAADGKTILATGGGANNTYLINKIAQKTSGRIILPDQKLIDFKEALIFAFLGVLAYHGQINVYASATGSAVDHIGGLVYRIEK